MGAWPACRGGSKYYRPSRLIQSVPRTRPNLPLLSLRWVGGTTLYVNAANTATRYYAFYVPSIGDGVKWATGYRETAYACLPEGTYTP